MNHLGLFEGIGGFSLAARWMGWKTVAWVEINTFCQQVLKKNFPEAKGYGDIKEFDGTKYNGAVDILTGGFPCQPYSYSGLQKGDKDERHLWPEMLRVIGEIQPRFVVGENVHGLLNWSNGLVFERVQVDLEAKGYQVFAVILPACSVNAPHRRERIWFIANLNSKHSSLSIQQWRQKKAGDTNFSRDGAKGIVTNLECQRLQEQWETRKFKSNPTLPNLRRSDKPGVGRGIYGIPNRVDRIKGLGNSIVPQVAFEIFKAIEKTIYA